MYEYLAFKDKTHRLIPSRYPPISLFDWADSPEELEQIALLEGMTNDRLSEEYGRIGLIAQEDWISGPGSTPLMAAFTHFGPSRFSDGHSYGVYYAGDSIHTAIAETRYHREIFLAASKENPCIVQMREYIAKINKKLVTICKPHYSAYYDPNTYAHSQLFGREVKMKKEWGIIYPSARNAGARCLAIFRPKALTIPVQSGHYDYIWNGSRISEIRKSIRCKAVAAI